MPLRTLYIQRGLSIIGHSSLAGRQLYDQFRNISEDCLLSYMVVPTEEAFRFSDTLFQNDIISYDLIKRLDLNFIYIEGGLFANEEIHIKVGFFQMTKASGGSHDPWPKNLLLMEQL
jgi:hypothetical protein